MKKSSVITTVESKATFQEKLLEDFINSGDVYKTIRGKNANEKQLPDLYKKIDCCFAQVPVTGTVNMLITLIGDDEADQLRIPVASAFLVTCTKKDTDIYKVTWSFSLS